MPSDGAMGANAPIASFGQSNRHPLKKVTILMPM